jgi:hypothetical protein
MHDSRRYRERAAECLLAAEEARRPPFRRVDLSMTLAWLSLARQDAAMDDMLADWVPPELIKITEAA